MINMKSDASRIKKHCVFFIASIFFGFTIHSCSSEDFSKEGHATDGVDIPKDSIDTTPNPIDSDEDGPLYEGETGNVRFYVSHKIDPGYVLVNDTSDSRVYLMNKEAEILYEWDLAGGIGNDAELLPDGRLLVSLQDENPVYDIGGYGGRIQLINPDRSIAWDFIYSSDEHLAHHDVEMLPNGNILILAWQRKSIEEAIRAGFDNSSENEIVLPESLIEVNPLNDQVVWEWHSWNHLVQDFDETKDNFGSISQNPQLIDINFHDDERGDIMHANGFDYDREKDLIYVSVNFYSEVWVIDHSTTTEEAASHRGGHFNKGGDLLYRFGNPVAYKNEKGGRLFFNNHFPNILTKDEIGAGNLLIYMNGNDGSERSITYELDMPETFKLLPDSNNEPLILSAFGDSELYSPIVGGAVRLSNGNTLITEGRYGYWEFTSTGEVVWKFEGNKLFWRGYHYNRMDSSIIALGL